MALAKAVGKAVGRMVGGRQRGWSGENSRGNGLEAGLTLVCPGVGLRRQT